MRKTELQFRNIIEQMDPNFAEYLMDFDYGDLEIDGITKINPFQFRKDYWSKRTDEVTINPNANLGNSGWKKNFCNLISELASPINKLSALSLIRKYGNRINSNGDVLVKKIIDGDLYHHNLTLYDNPYCAGLSVYPITFEGLDFFSNLKSNPPRRPGSFVNQVIRYLQYASNLFAGATALTDFFANYSYYTKNQTNYSDKQRENDLQNLVHGMSDEIRLSGQSPFTNLSILGPEVMRTMMGNYRWSETKIDDLIDEIMYNQVLYTRFFSKGMVGPDRKPIGLPFRFPITTLVADRSFEKEYPEEWREILEGNSDLCYLNILNQYDSDLKAISMCCRLTQDIEELLKIQVNNTFGSYLQVGSHAVVTINLPRIALRANKGEGVFLALLEEELEWARQLLQIHRIEILSKRRIKYHYFFKSGKLNLKRNFFSTIGFVGLADAVEYMEQKVSEQSGMKFAKMILDTMKKATVKFSQEDSCMYNLEQVPAESACATLALKDRKLGGTREYYTNQFVPLAYDVPLLKRIELEGELQSFCTGGSISHLNIDGKLDSDQAYNFTTRCLTNSKLTHFALNKGFTVCKDGHVAQSVYPKCPTCLSEEVDWATRIVGYFTNVSSWNRVKQLEFKDRVWNRLPQ